MAKIFISSTFQDLKVYREAASKALRNLGNDVIGMEDYLASDERPRARALRDVDACDLYLGIFGWWYGYIPPEDNPDRLSITELEYRRARETGKPILIFMVHEDALSPRSAVDSGVDNNRIIELRAELSRDRVVEFFESVDDFVAKLVAAVTRWKADSANPPNAVGLEQLPLAWRLVVDFKAYPDLLRHMDPAAFNTALEKWEKENGANLNLPWPARLEAALKELERKQSAHAPSELWLAWMRATRADSPEEGHEIHEA